MRLSVRLTYPAAPETVAEMFADEGFHRALCTATGDAQATITVESQGPGLSVTTARRLSTDGLPDMMKSFVGSTVTAVQRTRWSAPAADGRRDGQVEVEVRGTPVRLSAQAVLFPEGERTCVSYVGDLTAKVPLMGAAVERATEPLVRSALEAEQQVGETWLRERSQG
ncbi:DUF2505 domain-containing protein [Austwickia chelonae]|uniref:DUF2505 domain-containing protein n=1 Tax=Austwickia chelonae NBRC 105200 TaxID=1184607 RepID=K6V809_9MICO|nr:DUF2505 domain-containing protein [Austwickia chelonae]GAB78363.1 hypothetical protein AUCHE_08_06100 [Austwickia chelonae NBRC 105200]